MSWTLKRGKESGNNPIIIATFPSEFAGLGAKGTDDSKCNFRRTWVAQGMETGLTIYLNGGLRQGQVYGSQATVNNLGARAFAGGTANGVEASNAADWVQGIRETDPALLQELFRAAVTDICCVTHSHNKPPANVRIG